MAGPLPRPKPKPQPAPKKEAPADRLPPHSTEAEVGVLGCIMLDADASLSVCVPLFKPGPEVFYDLRHRVIYDCLVDMWDKKWKIDIITLSQRLKDAGQLDQVG